MTTRRHHLLHRAPVTRRAIERATRHEPRPAMTVDQALREADVLAWVLEAAPAVIEHCRKRGTVPPNPWALRDHADACGALLRGCAHCHFPALAGQLRRAAVDVDTAALLMMVGLVRRGLIE